MGTRSRLLVIAGWLVAACAEGQGAGPGPGGDAAVVDAPEPDESSPDGNSSRPPDAAPVSIDAGPSDASVTAVCDPDNPCAASQCCHFFVCVPGRQTPLLCLVEPTVPTCGDSMPCGAEQCCHFGRCIPGASPLGVCVPRTE